MRNHGTVLSLKANEQAHQMHKKAAGGLFFILFIQFGLK